jgi:hypothetical protein
MKWPFYKCASIQAEKDTQYLFCGCKIIFDMAKYSIQQPTVLSPCHLVMPLMKFDSFGGHFGGKTEAVWWDGHD